MRLLVCLAAVALFTGCEGPSNKEPSPAPATAGPPAPPAPVAPPQTAGAAPAIPPAPVAPTPSGEPTLADAEAVLKKCLDYWLTGADPNVFTQRYPDISHPGGPWSAPKSITLSRYKIIGREERSREFFFDVVLAGNAVGKPYDAAFYITVVPVDGKWSAKFLPSKLLPPLIR